MKSFFKIFLLLLLVASMLTSCGQSQNDGAPEGFILASTPEVDGFTLYVPQGWTPYYTGDICCAYASTLDSSSVSCAAVSSALTPKAYFEASLPDYQNRFGNFTVSEESESKIADRTAYHVAFTGDYKEVSYGYRQAIVDGGDGILFVLTCQAETTKAEGQTLSRYEQHAQSFVDLISHFKVNGAPQKRPEPTYETEAPEGMKCASDKRILGCLVFVPQSWTVTVSDGLVSAVAEDGSNIQAMQLFTQGKLKDYFENLVKDYEKTYDSVTVVSMPNVEQPETIGGNAGFRLQLTVTHEGQTFTVEQVMLRDAKGLRQGAYLFTFVAKSENAAKHQADWQRILETVEMS